VGEFEYDAKNLLYVRIDASGSSSPPCSCARWACAGRRDHPQLLHDRPALRADGKLYWAVNESLVGLRAAKDITIPNSDIVIHAGKKITNAAIAALRKANIEAVEVSDAELEGAFAAGTSWIPRPARSS